MTRKTGGSLNEGQRILRGLDSAGRKRKTYDAGRGGPEHLSQTKKLFHRYHETVPRKKK